MREDCRVLSILSIFKPFYILVAYSYVDYVGTVHDPHLPQMYTKKSLDCKSWEISANQNCMNQDMSHGILNPHQMLEITTSKDDRVGPISLRWRNFLPCSVVVLCRTTSSQRMVLSRCHGRARIYKSFVLKVGVIFFTDFHGGLAQV